MIAKPDGSDALCWQPSAAANVMCHAAPVSGSRFGKLCPAFSITLSSGKTQHALPPHDTLPAADTTSALLQSVHDLRVVWPPALQGRAAVGRDPGKLGHRVRRILLRGAGEPLRQRGLFGGAAQDDAGGDHAAGLLGLLAGLPEGADQLESP